MLLIDQHCPDVHMSADTRLFHVVFDVLKLSSRILIFGLYASGVFFFVEMLSSACLTDLGHRLFSDELPSKCRRLAILRRTAEKLTPIDAQQGGLRCEECCVLFKHKKLLTRHMASRHLIGVQLFSCAICNGIFKRRASLQKHERIVHELAVGISTNKSHSGDEGIW